MKFLEHQLGVIGKRQRPLWLVPFFKGIPLKRISPVYLKIKQEEQGFYRDFQKKNN